MKKRILKINVRYSLVIEMKYRTDRKDFISVSEYREDLGILPFRFIGEHSDGLYDYRRYSGTVSAENFENILNILGEGYIEKLPNGNGFRYEDIHSYIDNDIETTIEFKAITKFPISWDEFDRNNKLLYINSVRPKISELYNDFYNIDFDELYQNDETPEFLDVIYIDTWQTHFDFGEIV